jgi:hypothetical protein
MAKDGNDSDGLGDTHLALWESKLTKADESRIKSECTIPKYIKIQFDEEKSGVMVRSDCHKVYLYEAMFKTGFRLPFIPFIWELFHHLDLAPHQLAPNTWRILHSCMVLWPLVQGKENQLTMKKFLHLYRIQKNPKGSGVYNFQTKRGKFI